MLIILFIKWVASVKILLLNPPMNYGAYNQAGRLYVDKSYPPLGLGYIAAVLERAGFKVKLIDMIDASFEDAETTLRMEKPDVIGISCNLTDFRWGALKLSQIAKHVDSNIVVILGGSHATYLYKQILENFPVDYIVRFEGELASVELLTAIEHNSDVRHVRGIAYRNEKGEVKKNKDRPPIGDLDSLPFPAQHLFNPEKYIHYSSPIRFRGQKVKELESRNLMASRGCPFNCKYCSVTRYWHRHCRLRSARNVVDEMEMLHKHYGINHFNFFDDTFTLKPERVIILCKEILKRKLDVCWECVTRVDYITEKMLSWMKKAGCLSISYGVESGSPTVLKKVNKKYTHSQIVKAFRMTHEAGILAYILLMVGNPNESEVSINETVELIRVIKPDKIRTTLTMVYPATDLYQTCKKIGFINDSYWLTEKAAPIYTAEKSIKQLKKWERRITFAYYLQRKQLIKIFQMLVYRTIFSNIREIARRANPRIDEYMEKLDHMLHQL